MVDQFTRDDSICINSFHSVVQWFLLYPCVEFDFVFNLRAISKTGIFRNQINLVLFVTVFPVLYILVVYAGTRRLARKPIFTTMSLRLYVYHSRDRYRSNTFNTLFFKGLKNPNRNYLFSNTRLLFYVSFVGLLHNTTVFMNVLKCSVEDRNLEWSPKDSSPLPEIPGLKMVLCDNFIYCRTEIKYN